MYLYGTFIIVFYTQGAQAWMAQFYLQITPYLPLPHKHSPDSASPDWGYRHLVAAYYLFIYPERIKGWVGLIGCTVADGLPTWVVSRQLQVECRTEKVHWSKTDILSLCYATNRPTLHSIDLSFFHAGQVAIKPPSADASKRAQCTSPGK